MRFIYCLLSFLVLVQSEKRYYATYINNSEWKTLKDKINFDVDIRSQNKMTDVCYYLGLFCN